jgi:hypothetical protein
VASTSKRCHFLLSSPCNRYWQCLQRSILAKEQLACLQICTAIQIDLAMKPTSGQVHPFLKAQSILAATVNPDRISHSTEHRARRLKDRWSSLEMVSPVSASCPSHKIFLIVNSGWYQFQLKTSAVPSFLPTHLFALQSTMLSCFVNDQPGALHAGHAH